MNGDRRFPREELPGERSRRSMYHAKPRLTNITFLAFDTETTGLQPIVQRLVEVGAVRFRLDGNDTATFQQLIDPNIPIPPEVQRVHGITDAMVRGKPAIEHVLPRACPEYL